MGHVRQKEKMGLIAPSRVTKITIILMLLQKQTALTKLLVDVEKQTFHTAKARRILRLNNGNLTKETRLLVRSCLEVWQDVEDVDIQRLFGGLFSTRHLDSAICAVKYYLLA